MQGLISLKYKKTIQVNSSKMFSHRKIDFLLSLAHLQNQKTGANALKYASFSIPYQGIST